MARILKEYPSVALRPEDLDGKIDFVQIFGRSSPVHIKNWPPRTRLDFVFLEETTFCHHL